MNMNINEIVANRALEFMGHEKGDYAKVSPNSSCEHVAINQ